MLGGLALLSMGVATSPLQSLADVLKSRACDTPCVLILENTATKHFLKAFWINYDGMQIILLPKRAGLYARFVDVNQEVT